MSVLDLVPYVLHKTKKLANLSAAAYLSKRHITI
jgi:hypothetical protein